MKENQTLKSLQNPDIKKSKFFTFLVVFMMFGHTYIVPGLPLHFGELFILGSFFLLLLCRSHICIKISKTLLIFFVYGSLISIVSAIMFSSYTQVFVRVIRDVFYWILICVFCESFLDYDYFKKIVKMFCIALSCMIFLQVAVYYLTGFFIPGLFMTGMIDSNTTGRQVHEHILFWIGHAGYLKPYGFLSEAAHCAQALFIGALFLFDTEKTKKRSNSTFFLLCL